MSFSGQEILRQLGTEIIIEPVDPSRINPNSYNLSLANELLVYENDLLDMKTPNPTRHITIPPEGLVLEPGRLYLGRTNEFTRTDKYIPMLEGQRDLAMWVLRATGRWRSSVSSPSASIRMSRSARSITMTLTANMSPTRAANTRTTPAFSPA